MPVITDSIISSTQTTYDNNDHPDKQIVTVFDENQHMYEFLAWHSCPISSNFDQQLIILVKEKNNDHRWLGTLTTTSIENKSLTWKNHLYQRQHELRLSEQIDSIIIHFEIRETIDSAVNQILANEIKLFCF